MTCLVWISHSKDDVGYTNIQEKHTQWLSQDFYVHVLFEAHLEPIQSPYTHFATLPASLEVAPDSIWFRLELYLLDK